MNLILFDPAETQQPLARTDPRAVHMLDVLHRKVGDSCDVGLVDGPRGKAQIIALSDTALQLGFTWSLPPPPLDPIHLWVGLCRPQTARKILQDATTLGVARINFVRTDRSEPSYAQSSLWSSGEWRRHLISGAEQAFSTQLPSVQWNQTLAVALEEESARSRAEKPKATPNRVALDNYEASAPLLTYSLSRDRKQNDISPVTLAIGGERGWTNEERAALRTHGFVLTHLGERVLRTETAVVASLALIKAAFRFI